MFELAQLKGSQLGGLHLLWDLCHLNKEQYLETGGGVPGKDFFGWFLCMVKSFVCSRGF